MNIGQCRIDTISSDRHQAVLPLFDGDHYLFSVRPSHRDRPTSQQASQTRLSSFALYNTVGGKMALASRRLPAYPVN